MARLPRKSERAATKPSSAMGQPGPRSDEWDLGGPKCGSAGRAPSQFLSNGPLRIGGAHALQHASRAKYDRVLAYESVHEGKQQQRSVD
jgi:hypothetical protein